VRFALQVACVLSSAHLSCILFSCYGVLIALHSQATSSALRSLQSAVDVHSAVFMPGGARTALAAAELFT
jgi:hypothetical protein